MDKRRAKARAIPKRATPRRATLRQPTSAQQLNVIIITIIALVFAMMLIMGTNNYVYQNGAAAGKFFRGSSGGGSLNKNIAGKILCKDTDKFSLGTRGSCMDRNGVKTDYCWDNYSVVEYVCGAGKCAQGIYNCSNYGYNGGCVNGACVNVTPQNHLECVSQACTLVSGAGQDLCSTNADCNATNQTADLIVEVITFSSTNNTNSTNSSVSVSARIKNIGTATAGATTTRINVMPTGGNRYISTQALAPSQTAIVVTTYNLTAGTYNATATADWYNVVAESDENNNDLTSSFTV